MGKKSVKVIVRGASFGLALLVPVACASRVEVLDDKNGLVSEGSDPTRHVWPACEPSELDGSAKVGDGCSWATSPCGRNDACSNRFFDCNAGSLCISDTNLLDCEGTTMSANPVGWTECGAALASGHTADTCSGEWSCSQTTDDPCCVEVGWCRGGGLVFPSDQPVLYRARLCEEKCGEIPVRTHAEMISGCLSAGSDAPAPGTPCQGTFVCDRLGNDLSLGSTTVEDIGFDRFYWCQNDAIESLFLTLPWLH